jgi:hypothetical protein
MPTVSVYKCHNKNRGPPHRFCQPPRRSRWASGSCSREPPGLITAHRSPPGGFLPSNASVRLFGYLFCKAAGQKDAEKVIFSR